MPFKVEKSAGEFIRDYLLEHGEAYIMEIWREYRKFRERQGFRAMKYDSFRVLVWHLKDAGLVEITRVEPVRFGIERHYYRVTAPLDHPGWRDVLKVKGFREKKKKI